MDIAEIRQRVQEEFGDLFQAQLVNAAVLRWANSGCLDIVRRTGCLAAVSSVPFTSGLVTASLPASFLKFINAGYVFSGAWTSLVYTDYQDLVTQVGLVNALSPVGAPQQVYIRPDLNVIGTWPVANNTYNLQVEHVKRPVPLVADADIPEIPVQYHDLIVLYALHRAAKLDDDPQRASTYELEYQEGIAQTLSDAANPVGNAYPQVRSVEDYV